MDEIAWIIDTPGERDEQHFDGSNLLSFDSGPFRGFMERTIIRPGVALYRASGVADHDWQLTPIGSSPAGNLVLGAMLGGAGSVEAAGNERRNWRGGGRPYVLGLADREITYHLQASERWNAVTLLLEPEALEDLASEHQLPPIARAVLDNGRLPVSELLEADRTVTRSVQEPFNPPYRGALASLWREGKALEMLSYHLDQLGEAAPAAVDLGTRDLQRVREAHEILLSDLRSPPGLQVLAAAVRLSPRRLNQCFRLVYGMTVFEALLEARVQAAYHMVRECPQIPLKNLAWQVGYNQLSNFINAYRRRFGLSPGHHRRMDESD